MVIALLFMTLLTGTITFVAVLWFHGLPFAVIGASFAASVSVVLAGAILASRQTGSAIRLQAIFGIRCGHRQG